MRNAVLLAHNGVATEGDAVRAMDQIIANPNDAGVVKANLELLKRKNLELIELKKKQIGRIYQNYGAEPPGEGAEGTWEAPQQPRVQGSPSMPPSMGTIPPAVQSARDADRLAILLQELEQNPNDLALRSEIARMTGGKAPAAPVAAPKQAFKVLGKEPAGPTKPNVAAAFGLRG